MWSYYRNNNTVKYLIGITPQGTICFISKGWGGRIIYGDTVMAYRGFNIAETVATHGARLEIPSFTKGKEQKKLKVQG